MKPALSASALRVQAALGDGHQVLEFDRSVRTAAEAAATIGCTVSQIAKSIVFRAVTSGRPVLAIASVAGSGFGRLGHQPVGTLAHPQDMEETALGGHGAGTAPGRGSVRRRGTWQP
jgi:hypothetical protein